MLPVIPSHLWEYLVTACLIILAPGPSVLFTIARAIAWGRGIAIATVFGNAVGMLLISVLIALGLGPFLQKYHWAYVGIQWFGGSYLIYLGYQAIKSSTAHAEEMSKIQKDKPSTLKTISEGFWVGALNPKSVVFFAAILPQFTDRARGHMTSQLLLLGIIFAIMAFLSDSSWGILAGTLRKWLATDVKRLVRLRVGGGSVMMILGVLTLLNSLRS